MSESSDSSNLKGISGENLCSLLIMNLLSQIPLGFLRSNIIVPFGVFRNNNLYPSLAQKRALTSENVNCTVEDSAFIKYNIFFGESGIFRFPDGGYVKEGDLRT